MLRDRTDRFQSPFTTSSQKTERVYLSTRSLHGAAAVAAAVIQLIKSTYLLLQYFIMTETKQYVAGGRGKAVFVNIMDEAS